MLSASCAASRHAAFPCLLSQTPYPTGVHRVSIGFGANRYAPHTLLFFPLIQDLFSERVRRQEARTVHP